MIKILNQLIQVHNNIIWRENIEYDPKEMQWIITTSVTGGCNLMTKYLKEKLKKMHKEVDPI